jgi:cytochrome P450
MPVFAPRNLTALTPVMTDAAEASCRRIAARPGRQDMYQEMLQTAFEVIAAVSMSEDTAIPREVAHKAIDRYLETAGKASLMDILKIPAFVPRPKRVVGKAIIADLIRATDAAVEARMGREPADPPPLLDLLIGASDPETGRTMTAEELRDNLLTFLVAGHETTALTLSWALYLVAFDREVQERARAEAQAVLGDRPAEAEDVEKLPYIRQILLETMRLYPPVAILSRTAMKPDMLRDREVRRGGQVIDLLPREFALLEHLLRRKGRVQTRTMLLENVWDIHFDPGTNVVETHISRLRAKVDKPFDHDLIRTVRGAGYRIDD